MILLNCIIIWIFSTSQILGSDKYFMNMFYEFIDKIKEDPKSIIHGLIAQYFTPDADIDIFMIWVFNAIIEKYNSKSSLYEKKNLIDNTHLPISKNERNSGLNIIASIFNLGIHILIIEFSDNMYKEKEIKFTHNNDFFQKNMINP